MKIVIALLFLLSSCAWAGYVSPDANNNPGVWTNPTYAYDLDTLTPAVRSGVPLATLILYRAGLATDCDSIRYKGTSTNGGVAVHYSAGWHTVHSGAWTDAFTNYAVNAGDTESVDSVKFTTSDGCQVFELYLWDTTPAAASGDTTRLGGTGTDTLRIGGAGTDTVRIGQ